MPLPSFSFSFSVTQAVHMLLSRAECGAGVRVVDCRCTATLGRPKVFLPLRCKNPEMRPSPRSCLIVQTEQLKVVQSSSALSVNIGIESPSFLRFSHPPGPGPQGCPIQARSRFGAQKREKHSLALAFLHSHVILLFRCSHHTCPCL